jgi:2-keto-4-pentenoate hydratase
VISTRPVAPTADIDAAARRLVRAAETHVPCAPVRDLIGSNDLDAAYAVQREIVERRVAAGARRSGRKIGLTSPSVQAQLGVDRPDFGVLLDDMDVSDRDQIPLRSLLQPRIEAEIAFVLAADLDQDNLTVADVSAAVSKMLPALEIVDSRIQDWAITFGDTVADNASSGLYVLGREAVPLRDVRPREVVMEMSIDDETVSRGTGADCLGDPLEALAWLARTSRDFGDPLRAGEVVLSGALGPMAPVTAGCRVRAHITGLGQVTANFSEIDA